MRVEAPKPPIKRWSFSSLHQDEKCPFATYLKYVEKVPSPPRDENHPSERGTRIHAEAERFVKGEIDQLTPLTRKISEDLHRLREKYQTGLIRVEEKWGFTRDEWDPVSWSDERCCAMVRCDVVDEDCDGGGTIEVIDYKSGKRMGNEVKHMQQMQLYAIATLMKYPEKRLVKTTLLYTDEGKRFSKTMDRSALPVLLGRWEERANKLLNRLVFPPKPNRANCRFCDYGVQNGNGHCPYAVGDSL